MDRHSPNFLIEVVGAFVAEKYLISSASIDLISKKVSQLMSSYYVELSPDFLTEIADNFLRILLESQTENSDAVLQSFIYNRIIFSEKNKTRNWNSIFSNPMKGQKDLSFDFGLSKRNFRAFVFRFKNHNEAVKPDLWALKDFEQNEFLQKLGLLEFSPFDFLD
jgi:hypothetical protein